MMDPDTLDDELQMSIDDELALAENMLNEIQ
jgi:hypothetical protein